MDRGRSAHNAHGAMLCCNMNLIPCNIPCRDLQDKHREACHGERGAEVDRRTAVLTVKRHLQMGSIADNTSGRSYAYRASKTALNQVTKSLSIDLEGQGITCVLLHPGDD